MFDLSLSEIALIAVVAVLVVDPKDLPKIARTCRGWWKEIRTVTDEIRAGVHDIVEESGALDVQAELEQDARHLQEAPRYIEDMKGNLQRVYDISDLVKIESSQQQEAEKPSPSGRGKGEGGEGSVELPSLTPALSRREREDNND